VHILRCSSVDGGFFSQHILGFLKVDEAKPLKSHDRTEQISQGKRHTFKNKPLIFKGSGGLCGQPRLMWRKMGRELINREIFYTVKETHAVIERWRRELTPLRPNSLPNYHPMGLESTINRCIVNSDKGDHLLLQKERTLYL
jgi:hypothetical protein